MKIKSRENIKQVKSSAVHALHALERKGEKEVRVLCSKSSKSIG